MSRSNISYMMESKIIQAKVAAKRLETRVSRVNNAYLWIIVPINLLKARHKFPCIFAELFKPL